MRPRPFILWQSKQQLAAVVVWLAFGPLTDCSSAQMPEIPRLNFQTESFSGGVTGITVPAASQRESGSAEFQVYQLRHARPSDVRRVLEELLGETVREARIIADDDQMEIIVAGPSKIQLLAGQLIKELDQPEKTTGRLAAESNDVPVKRVLRTYEVSPAEIEQQMAALRTVLGDEVNISADPARGRILVLGSEQHHNAARQFLQRGVPVSARPDVSDRVMRVRFRNITSEQSHALLQRLLGTRLWDSGSGRCSYASSGNRSITLTFDNASQSCLLDGPQDLVQQFVALFEKLDDSQDRQQRDTIRFVPVSTVDPQVLNRAIRMWKQSRARSGVTDPLPEESETGEEHGMADPGVDRPDARAWPLIRQAGFTQQTGQITDAADPLQPLAGNLQDSGTDTPADMQGDDPANVLRRPAPDVQVEPLPDLDVLILRGRDPDVQELIRIIQEIERLSAETAPEIDIVYLRNVQGEALNQLITRVLQDLTGPLQGRVAITPLVKPNALLLIGWGEAVTAAKKLIARLDEAVPPSTQMKMFRLEHAPASQVENTIRQFLSGRGGLGPDVTVTSNARTNSLVVNAAPRDMQEVARLIRELDTGTSKSLNQAKMIRLKNALAVDVSQTITAAILAARGGGGAGGQQRSAALEMLMVGPDGRSVAASGLLDDVRLTPDARTNRILVTGPADSLPLVEQLIQSLDESPAASAQIKVFQISNGDASDLVQVLRSLFPEQAATSPVPQLATAANESSLVPVRFSVDIRTNSIIATGAAGDLRIIEALLLRLDESDSQERINQVYRLKNSPALDVANAVNNFLRSERVVAQAAPGRQNPFAQIESEVVVVPEPVGNALIISATPRYFEQIMELVEGLDAQPPQVMIQVILAEVELNNLHEFGVELGLQDSLLFDRSLLGSLLQPGFDFNNKPLGNANNANSLGTAGKVGGQALSHFSMNRISEDADFGGLVLSASSENISVLLRALNRTRNMEILSRPQIMTLDNQPAFIQVGQRVPRIVGTSINQVGQVNSVELENVGLILGVTPRISPEGMVVMEIDAEKSEVGPEAEGIPVSVSADGSVIRSPRVNITTAQTTISAGSGQTVVIGGLITTNNTSITRRVPWLSDVPLVGNLFRYDGNSNVRKELLIILTPHVIRGQTEAEYMKQVELARLSWISSDIFNWLNTETCITGELDGSGVKTIYPDLSPVVPESIPQPAVSPPLPRSLLTDPPEPVDPEAVQGSESPGNPEIRLMSFENEKARQSSALPNSAARNKAVRSPAVRNSATSNPPAEKTVRTEKSVTRSESARGTNPAPGKPLAKSADNTDNSTKSETKAKPAWYLR